MPERVRLRELAEQAYELELGAALDELETQFHRWRRGEIHAAELSQTIHQFHVGDSTQLFRLYNNTKDPKLVARAVGTGILDPSALGGNLLDKLETWIDFFGDRIENWSEPEAP